jgi:hypothetical protein
MNTNDLNNSRRIESFLTNAWNEPVSKKNQVKAIKALEQGKLLFFPELKVKATPEEMQVLINAVVEPNTKNISYDYNTKKIRGSQDSLEKKQLLKEILDKYAEQTIALINNHFPQYTNKLQIGRTSLRPVEIKGRISTSYRKDDTRLHVDAFPSSPNQGRRILRVFSNINPDGKPRTWRLGEDFFHVAQYFFPKIKPQIPGISWFMKVFKITKGVRTPYDHYMLNIHDKMKYDLSYQNTVDSEVIHIPANSSWVVFSDQVSHAVLSGQHMLEQTFYLPIEAMDDVNTSPIKILEKLAKKNLA